MISIYRELIIIFLKLGFFAYGGPAAHIAMMREEVVEKRKWFSDKEFLDLLSFTNMIPGPNSTEMAILIGYKKGAFPGLVLAGISFIVPAVIIVMLVTFFYRSFHHIPQIQRFFSGMVPAVFVIVLAAVYKLGRSAFSKAEPFVLLITALILLYFRTSELVVLLFGGLASILWHKLDRSKLFSIEPFSLSVLFLTFLRIGSFLYGSGYVLISFLQTSFVDHLQWLSSEQLLDLVAIGEMTPGPVFTTATAIGTFLGGLPGGLLATAGIFVPSFALILVLYPFYEKMMTVKWVSLFLDGVNIASISIMAFVALQLGIQSFTGLGSLIFCCVSLILLIRYRLNPIYLLIFASLLALIGLI